MIAQRVLLAELSTEHLDAVAVIESRSSPMPWSRALFAGELMMPIGARHWLVAMVGPEVVGFGGMMLVGDEAHLMNIAVDQAHRRRGFANLILRQLIVDVVEMGARHLTLEVRTDNTAALELYEQFGFESAGERNDYYGRGEHATIMWVYHIDAPEYLAGLHCQNELGETP